MLDSNQCTPETLNDRHTCPEAGARSLILSIVLRLLWLDLDLSKIAADLSPAGGSSLPGAIAAAQVDGLRNAAGCLLAATSGGRHV